MLIILDRDGVVNTDSPDYIKSPQEWYPIPGSLEAIAALKLAGHIVCVATNQSGIARGYYSLKTLAAIHQKMELALQQHHVTLDSIAFCPHIDTDNCTCRKPKPGLLIQLQQQFNIAWSDTVFIGDSMRDFQAAESVGCHFILVATGNGQQTKTLYQPQVPFMTDLWAVANHILNPSFSLGQ